MNLEGLATYSIRNLAQRDGFLRILEASLLAVEPGEAIRRRMQRDGAALVVDGRFYDLRTYRRVRLVGAGKAGAPMARAAAEILAPFLVDGIVIVKEGHRGELPLPEQVEFIEADHPIPDARGLLGARRMLELLADGQPDDLVIVLISGGGSALLTSPAPGITLDDLQSLTASLLACGADIQRINALRKHLDMVKGGGLARQIAPAQCVSLILSDVVGDPLDVIASGPTTPDPTTYSQAYQILHDYHLPDQTPEAILERLRAGMRGELVETPKPGDPLFASIQNVIVGSGRQAAEAALEAARLEGFNTLLLTTFLQGEARQAGRFLASLARQEAASGQPLARPACLIAGGETTVTLQPRQAGARPGLGGRNQELALGAVAELSGLKDVLLIALATDGGDGPTDAAGAVVSGETLKRARQLGLDPVDFLRRNDAYHFFAALDDLIMIGPTQTNVNDLTFLFVL